MPPKITQVGDGLGLGSLVRFREPLMRASVEGPEGPERNWVPDHRITATEGFLVGRRTLNVTRLEQDPVLGRYRWVNVETYQAYVVAYDLFRRPVPVLKANISPAHGGPVSVAPSGFHWGPLTVRRRAFSPRSGYALSVDTKEGQVDITADIEGRQPSVYLDGKPLVLKQYIKIPSPELSAAALLAGIEKKDLRDALRNLGFQA